MPENEADFPSDVLSDTRPSPGLEAELIFAGMESLRPDHRHVLKWLVKTLDSTIQTHGSGYAFAVLASLIIIIERHDVEQAEIAKHLDLH